MEEFRQNKQEISPAQLKELAGVVARLYVQAAEQCLEEGDSLRDRIVRYYTARSETEQELANVLKAKNTQEVAEYVEAVKMLVEDPVRFIEHMEKIYELQDVRSRRRDLQLHPHIASEEEYGMGAYADVLEQQVRDAVLVARKKGYLTFQSGFQEKSERNQFMDFYNKNVVIPPGVREYLQKKSIEVDVKNFDDRTTIVLRPVARDHVVRLSEWKEIWDYVVDALPQADTGIVDNRKTYGEHAHFRIEQDALRKALKVPEE